VNFIKGFIDRIDTRSIVIVGLLLGATALAVMDEKFRPIYGDLAKVGLGGYFGQLVPEKKNEQ
jgi:hypothetical protein